MGQPFGDDIFTGGKALESDILQKRIGFFKTLSEFVQFRGNRSILSGSLQASNSVDLIAVDSNLVYFIFAVSLQQVTAAVGNARAEFLIVNSGTIITQQVVATGVSNGTMNFSPPLAIQGGEILRMTKNNTNTNHVARINVTGYTLDKEISLEG